MAEVKHDRPQCGDQCDEEEEFSELVRYTLGGFLGGLLLAALLDWLGMQRSAVGQWMVRTLAGEGESLLEAVFAIRRRLTGATASLAEAYGWGKLLGITVPWVIDGGSRLAGVDVMDVEGFYIPYFYAMSDQIGASLSGLNFFRRREGTWAGGLTRFARHPVMLASLAVILAVPFGLLAARLLGFSPTTQVSTALETVAANLCWLPPVVGWGIRRRHNDVAE